MGIVDKLRRSVRSAAGRLRTCGCHRLSVSAWCAVGLLGLGLVQNMLGPTQLDIASHIHVQLSSMAPMFSVRGIGDLAASVTLGFLFDRFENWTYKLLYVTFGWAVWVTAVQPLSYNLTSYAVMMCLFGVGNGAVDIGVHVVLMKLWQDESGPFLLMADFAFTLGAFTAPLLAQPFLLDAASIAWPCSRLSSVFMEGEYSPECQRAANTTCGGAPFRDYRNGTLLEGYWNGTVSHKVLMEHDCLHDLLQNGTETYHLAYWIAVVPWVLCYVAFLYTSLTREGCCGCGWCPAVGPPKGTAMELLEEEAPRSANKDWLAPGGPAHKGGLDFKHYPTDPFSSRPTLTNRVSTYVFLFLFVMCYYGLLMTFGNLLFTFAVEGPGFTKVEATDLNSLFWGTYTFGRLFSILLVLLRVPPLVMIAANVAGSFFSLLPMVVLPRSPQAVWIGTAALGASMTAVFPTALTWLAQQVEITGKATAVMVAGAALGDMVLPAVVEELMAATSARALLYFALADVVVAGALVVALFALSRGNGATASNRLDERRKLTDEENESETEKQDVGYRWTTG